MGEAEALFYRLTGKRHLFNIVAIENIPSIMQYGILCYDCAENVPHCSIAMSAVQKRRSAIRIPNGNFLHQNANLYFDYHNPMLYKRKDNADSLCVLAVSASVLDFPDCIVSDRNAASGYARFYTALYGLCHLDFSRIYARDWNHPDDYYEYINHKSIKCAEVLVPFSIPPDLIEGAYVKDQDSEKALQEAGFDRRIVINPKVFYH